MIIELLAAWLLAAPGNVAEEVSRLAGQRVTVVDDGYVIDDIAGEGEPIVGVVERRGRELWLGDYRLTGPLARPRIAGPGYKVWALGEITGDTLRIRRIGILAPPRR
jgi:hypothetical protein